MATVIYHLEHLNQNEQSKTEILFIIDMYVT